MDESKCRTVQLEDDTVGGFTENTDLFFDKIGNSVPITPQNEAFFDLQNPPSRPLAVSEKFGLIFVAHSSGFWVARTKDVVDCAIAIKEERKASIKELSLIDLQEDVVECATAIKEGRKASSIQELSVVDVRIGKVHILALSADSSMLATSVGGDIHFFSVDLLLSKEQMPSYSCSLNNSSCVKDMQWIKKLGNSYVVLSNQGRLYYGALESPLKDVMDNVDAVEWSARENLVAVARKNTLSILSSTFKERLRMSLSFKSWVSESDENRIIQVDSIKWVRPDCIILGCLQLTAEDMEENYLVQVITTKNGKFTDDSVEPVVLSFSDLFISLIDDIVPTGSGPHMFLSYLEQCELAIAVNRKNTEEHIVLIGWSKEDEDGKASVLEFGREEWLPRIEVPDNPDYNLGNFVMGLAVDKVTVYGNIQIQLGTEEATVIPSYCVIFCLTVDGKLIMYHVASVAETADHALADSGLEQDLSQISSESVGEISEDEHVDSQLHNLDNKALHLEVPNEISSRSDVKSSEINISANPKVIVTEDLNEIPKLGPYQDTMGQQLRRSSWQSTELKQVDLKTSQLQETSSLIRDFSKEQTQKISEVGSRTNSFLGKFTKDTTQQSQVPSLSSFLGHKFVTDGPSVGFANTPGGGLHSKVTTQSALVVNTSSGPSLKVGQVVSTTMGNIDSLPSIGNMQFKSHNEKLPNYKVPATEKYRSSSLPGQRSVEPKLSEQFGNIKDMINELDTLLESVEENGGFRDASTTAQQKSLLALEQGILSLSQKCAMRKRMLDAQHKGGQNLLDKTVQVLARKSHIEGILKQASDTRYWDLWNRQNLSSELELKRRNVVELNQDLTSQLIKLERHFNTLELNKFGEDDGCYLGQKTQSRLGPSRHIQSMHSLHNTMNSQLAAAEKLSECLLKQMSVLSIESPEKRRSIRNELFETIGLPYDRGSFNSPDASKGKGTSSVRKLASSSGSISNKDQSRRIKSSITKSSEPETARRRRDSLDRSWASFEAPKTTVKRSVAQDIRKVKANKSPVSIDKQLRPHMLEGSVATHADNHATPSTSLYSSGNKGIQEMIPKQASESLPSSLFKWANDLPAPTQSVVPKSSTQQKKKFQVYPSQSVLQSSPILGQGSARESRELTAERPANGVRVTEMYDSATVNKSAMFSNSKIKETLVMTIGGNQKQPPLTTKSLSFESGKTNNTPFSALPDPKFPGVGFKIDSTTSKNQPGEKLLSSSTSLIPISTPLISPPFSIEPSAPPFSLPDLSSTAPTSSTVMPSFTIAKSTTEANRTISSSISSSSSFPVPSSESVSFQSKETASYLSPPVTSTSESPCTEVQPSMGIFSLKTVDNAVTEPDSYTTGGFGFKLASSESSAPAIEVSTVLASTNQPNLGSTTSIVSSAVFQEPLSTSVSATAGKIDTFSNNAFTQEDEMEEEASETTGTTAELSLGSLGGFGVGSAPNSTAPKTNPFGGSFGNTSINSVSPSFALQNSTGELFRPASLNFQSPQPSQPPQQTVSSSFSGGFGMGTTAQAPSSGGGFGQPSQIGPGQQALGSVLGGFGQSRQLGAGLPGVSGFASASGFGGGFTSTQPTGGGFANAATGGGFAGAASGGGGFAALASGGGGGGFAALASGGSGGFSGMASAGGGFSGMASPGSGFGTGEFIGTASGSGFPTAGGGFGAFNSPQGSGGFSGFGNPGTGTPSSQLFTQMRK